MQSFPNSNYSSSTPLLPNPSHLPYITPLSKPTCPFPTHTTPLSLSLSLSMAAKTSLILCLSAIWAVALAHGAPPSAHHAPSPSPSPDCSSVILNMADCLSFVSSGSTTMKPQGSCCSGFKTVLKTSPNCICEALKSSSQLGVSLNITKAMTLPAACKVSAPSFSNCGLSITPAAAPGMSPSSPASAPGTSGSGTASELSPTAAPVPSPGNSAPSSMIPISAGSLLVCMLAAIFSGF